MEIQSLARRVSAALACLFFAGCAGTVQAPSPPRSLKVTPEVAQSMLEIQREFEVETAKCLTGFVQDGTVYVTSMEPVWIREQSTSHVNFNSCTGSNVVGWYHNHPPTELDDGQMFLHCDLSPEADLETLKYGRSFWVGIITCDNRRIVYAFKLDPNQYEYLWSGEEP